jgi:hypothetical protein
MVKKQPNYNYHVLFAVTTGFLLVFVVHLAKGKLSLINTDMTSNTLSSTFKGDSVERAFIGWGMIALVLFAAAEFDSTAPLAAAFAWLILVSVLLINAETLVKIAGYYNKPLDTSKGK